MRQVVQSAVEKCSKQSFIVRDQRMSLQTDCLSDMSNYCQRHLNTLSSVYECIFQSCRWTKAADVPETWAANQRSAARITATTHSYCYYGYRQAHLQEVWVSNREHTKSPGGPARTVGANWLKIVSKLDSLRLHGGDGVTARLWVWTVSKF